MATARTLKLRSVVPIDAVGKLGPEQNRRARLRDECERFSRAQRKQLAAMRDRRRRSGVEPAAVPDWAKGEEPKTGGRDHGE